MSELVSWEDRNDLGGTVAVGSGRTDCRPLSTVSGPRSAIRWQRPHAESCSSLLLVVETAASGIAHPAGQGTFKVM
jgi:hypothetical protein